MRSVVISELDNDVIRSIFKKNHNAGEVIKYQEDTLTRIPKHKNALFYKLAKSNLGRLIRELFWKICKWETKSLDNWLKKYLPEVIFLQAGDSIFAYKIVKRIQKDFDCKPSFYL